MVFGIIQENIMKEKELNSFKIQIGDLEIECVDGYSEEEMKNQITPLDETIKNSDNENDLTV